MPPTHGLAVLVPVFNRPHRVKPLLKSYFESGTPGRLYFLSEVSDVDEQLALYEYASGHTRVSNVRLVDCHTWPEKINLGIKLANADWSLLAADDIHFHKGWWEATQPYREQGYGLIGTNDLGNPRVQDETLVIHPLISREYAAEGLIDNPDAGPVNEDYHHWCCDDELLWTAKIRGRWAYAHKAVIEHLHPYWGRAETDSTYQAGEQHAEEDLALWRHRAQHVLGLNLL